MPFLPPNQQRQSTEGNSTEGNNMQLHNMQLLAFTSQAKLITRFDDRYAVAKFSKSGV